jgi:hypothetical protein
MSDYRMKLSLELRVFIWIKLANEARGRAS